MDILLELLKIILPAGVVFATAYYLVKNFLDNENKKRLSEIRLANQGKVTPIRLQAYERVTLLLERISPQNLIMRVHRDGMSARLLQADLLKTIRSEFEHNLSQQIYMSNHAWEMVKTAKEETIKLVNIASSKVKDNASGLELSQVILQVSSQVDKLPTQAAIDYLKKEIKQTF